MKGIPTQPPGCRVKHFRLFIFENRRERQRPSARWAAGVEVTAHAEIVFRFFVIGLELIVTHRPIREIGAGDGADKRFQMECFRVKPPGVRAIIDRPAADAGGKRPIEPVARVNHPRRRLRVRPHGSDFGELRAEGRWVDRARKTLPEFAMAEALSLEPRPSFEQKHFPAGRRELFRHHAAAGSCSDHNRVHTRVSRAHIAVPSLQQSAKEVGADQSLP